MIITGDFKIRAIHEGFWMGIAIFNKFKWIF